MDKLNIDALTLLQRDAFEGIDCPEDKDFKQSDFKQSDFKQSDFKQLDFKQLVGMARLVLISKSNANFQKANENWSIDTLIPSKRAKFDRWLEEAVDELARFAIGEVARSSIGEVVPEYSLEEHYERDRSVFPVFPKDFSCYDPETTKAMPFNKRAMSSRVLDDYYEDANLYVPSSPIFEDLINKFMSKNDTYKYADIKVSDLDLDQESTSALKIEVFDYTKRQQHQLIPFETNKNLQKANENHSIDMLIPSRRKEFDRWLERQCTRIADAFIDGFFNKQLGIGDANRSLNRLCKSDLFTIYQDDFLNSDLKNTVDCRYESANRLRRKLLVNQSRKVPDAYEKECQSSLSTKEALMLYKFASEESNKNINDLSESDIKNVEDKFYESLENKAKEQREKIYNDLMTEGPQASASPSKKKVPKKTKKKQTKIAPSGSHSPTVLVDNDKIDIKTEGKEHSTLSKMVFGLNNDFSMNFSLHPRVSRWSKPGLDHIKKFGPSYEEANRDRLQYMKNCHNLAGIERILSKKELKDKYSFVYTVRDNISAEGRGFYATMNYPNANSESGVIYVAFNKKSFVIYHSMFVHVSKKFSIKDLKNIGCEGDYGMTEDEISGWENNSRLCFDLDKDDKISMQIGRKSKNRVSFVFESLDLGRPFNNEV